jgi:hypothetical protein
MAKPKGKNGNMVKPKGKNGNMVKPKCKKGNTVDPKGRKEGKEKIVARHYIIDILSTIQNKEEVIVTATMADDYRLSGMLDSDKLTNMCSKMELTRTICLGMHALLLELMTREELEVEVLRIVQDVYKQQSKSDVFMGVREWHVSWVNSIVSCLVPY